MSAEDLTLNIAVNLGRVARWVGEGKFARVGQFIKETDDYLRELDRTGRGEKFEKTYITFKLFYEKFKQNQVYDDVWAEEALTWSNILTHRAKFA